MPPRGPLNARALALAAVAKETQAALPGIVQQLPHLQPSQSVKHNLEDLPPLDPSLCPKFKLSANPESHGTLLKVFNSDTFDAALQMPSSVPDQEPGDAQLSSSFQRNSRVAVLNLASDKNPGGGWLRGSSAQEEALCYRSSLYLSLHKSYYPWKPLDGIYTRDVVIIRSSKAEGHKLLVPEKPADQLAVVSVISVAGIRQPMLSGDKQAFGLRGDRDLTKDKMRLVLRVAARERHEILVLGAIGCGAFKNPPRDVAKCWSEVLQEDEFKGGWWREIWFAVFDARNEGNFGIFEEMLGDKTIGVV
ncbi:hypothetical protein SCARD494_08887 [Seiridium cardinale]